MSNSIGVFGGNFVKGPVGTYTLITSVDDLLSYYGYPTNKNYNDFYQAYNFLQYGNKLLLARAANTNGSAIQSGAVVSSMVDETITVSDITVLTVDQMVTFGEDDEVYMVVSIDEDNSTITLDRTPSEINVNDDVNTFIQAMNGVIEASDELSQSVVDTMETEYVNELMVIENASDFESKEVSLAFSNNNSKVKFFARNPGSWANDIEIAIAKPDAFNTDTASYAFEGIALDDLFEYTPSGTEVGVIIKSGDVIVEIFTVDFNESAKDFNNKSTYIETVINNQSSYVFVKDNTANENLIADYCHSVNGAAGSTLKLKFAADSDIQADDLLTAYELFDNKEEIDVDIIIGNELDSGISAKNLVDTRKDCIAFVGAEYGDTVGKKSATAVSNLIEYRKSGAWNYNNMFVVACGNYKYQYDRYNDKYRWINIAGDIAGLRAQTSMNRASWWASAGLERGQIKNVTKLAFNPTQGQRDLLYKNGINPICSFPGQGTVMWGQKTLLAKPSSFDRVNVRGLFNTMERALSKMAKYQVMEFNDNFTRNRIVSMIKPYLSSVQAGRGIQDFLVICDESNNTADVISRNQLIVDIYIKPTYVAEFINLRFTNAGTNSFSEIIGG